jgi:alpha-L-fucosidase
LNCEAIYSTRAVAPYKSGNICFTQNKTTKSVYAIYLPQENETLLPSEVIVEGITPAPGTKVELLGVSGSLKWQKTATGFKIFVPSKLQNSPPCGEAWSFKIHTIK